MWRTPLRLFLLAILAAASVVYLDRLLASGFDPFPDLNWGTVASIMGVISAAMITLAGLVLSALTSAMSLGVTSLSVRIAPIFRQIASSSGDLESSWQRSCSRSSSP